MTNQWAGTTWLNNLDSVQSAGDNSLGTSSFGGRPGVESTLPCQGVENYIERSAPFTQSEKLFVCFGSRTKGCPVTKLRLSRWIIDAITLAYSSLGQQCPMGVRSHLTRGIASSWAWSSGVSIAEKCAQTNGHAVTLHY